MAKKAKTKDVAKKTIEQTLWDSANELRGNLDAAEYKSVVLGLVFLKYINDCFKVKHDELIAEGAGFEEDPDEYIGDNIFFVPVDARWDKIVKASLTAEIGVVVDAAMEALEKENKQLRQEYKEAKTLIEHYKNLYFDTKQKFNDFQKDVKFFIEERDLMQGFREFLYKLRPERYKNPNQTQEQSKARQTEPKRVIRTSTPSKGMER